MDIYEKQRFVFGSLFLLANRLQVVGDQYLAKDDMTTKQWFLSVVISQFRDHAPTLSEVAELMGSSRQNVKQLALKLAEKEFLTIEKDAKDARALRLVLTEKSQHFWDGRQEQDDRFIRELFRDIGGEEMDALARAIGAMIERTGQMARRAPIGEEE